jgi:rubrerythrin
MVKKNDPKSLAGFINCLSILENDAFLLYTNLADKVEPPLVKSLLLHIAIDSHKHSIALKGVSDSIGKSEGKPKECEKKVGEAWRVIKTLNREISKKENISGAELSQLSEKLAILESIIGEEYYMFVQLKTLTQMMKEINQIYSVDLSSLRSIFTRIIQDEETHRVLLEKIKGLVERKEKADSAPAVKYQHPDAWNTPMPPTA